MLTFTQWLDESYKFEEDDAAEDSHIYGFKDHKGTNYKVFIEKDRETGHHNVLFGNERNAAGNIGFKKTDDQGPHARKIFSTVHNIMKHHAKENPHVKRYTFISDKGKRGPGTDLPEPPEGSRNKLYRRMTDRLGGHSVSQRYEVHHHIPAEKL